MEKANNICSANTQFERHKSLGKASNSLEKWQTLQKKIFQRALKMPGVKAKSSEVPPKKISGKSH